MAISIKDQFYLSFSVGDFNDFVQLEDLVTFTEISEAGNSIPTFEIVFWTSEESIYGLLHEGNEISISFGKNVSEARDYFISVTKLEAKVGQGRSLFRVLGILGNLGYVSNPKKRIVGPVSGVEVAAILAEENGFDFDSNIETSKESMRWIQPNITDRKFLSDVLRHSYVENSFISFGISSDNILVVRDIRKMVKTDPVWVFTQSLATQDNEIMYDSDPDYETNTGFINYWAGYGQEKLVFSLENEDFKFVSEDVRPVIALTDQIARKAGQEKRFQTSALQNENTHSNYWKAALQNVVNAAIFGSHKITLTFRQIFRDVRLLDLVSFADFSISDNRSSSQAQSGFYIVSKVARTVKNKQLTTTVVLCRESANDVTGNIRQAVIEENDDSFALTDPEGVAS